MQPRLARLCQALALPLLIGLMSPSVGWGANLLANPGFEASGGSYDGWFTFGNNVLISTADNDDIYLSGGAASKIFGDFGGCPGPPAPGLRVNGYGQAFTPTPGLTYSFKGYSFISSADTIPGTNPCSGIENLAVAKVAFFNATVGGTEIASNEMVIGDSQTPTDQWIPFSVSIPAPSGAMRVEALILYLQRECDPGAVYVDDTSLEETPPPPEANLLANPSYTTGLTGWSTFGNVFPESQASLTLSAPGSGKMFSTFTADSPSGMSQSFPATGGSAWTLDVYALTNCADGITATDNFAVAKIVFRDGGSAEIGSAERVILDHDSPVNSWRPTTVSAYAPANTETVEAFLLFISPSLQGGAIWFDNISFRELDRTGVPSEPGTLPFRLLQNTPNPFSPSTRIAFELDERGEVDVSVFNISGRLVATLQSGMLEAGPHSVTWDGRTSTGGRAAAGVYRYVLTTSSGRTSRSMVLIR